MKIGFNGNAVLSFNPVVAFNNDSVRMRTYQEFAQANAPSTPSGPSASSLLQVHYLREALQQIRPGRLMQSTSSVAAVSASAISNSQLNFSTGTNTTIRGIEEINTAPTSFQQNGPTWNGSTETAPWSGLGSTAAATVGGSYDGSSGQGVLKFQVNRGGTHGDDDVRLKVYTDDGNQIATINIGKNDPLNQVYQMANGLEISLGTGDLVKNDYFEVDTAVLSTSYTPNDPGWNGSTAKATIGGVYLGSNGTGDLKFEVDRAGVHGEDDLKINVYAPDESFIETVSVKKNDAIDKVYVLSNGLTFSLGEGELIKNETFNVSVEAGNPTNFTAKPDWNFGSATATLTGTYDGSNGTGTLTFEARQTGVHGEDDIQVRVYAPDGSVLENIDVSNADAVDTAYQLSNGLSVTFSAGDFIKNETFTVDIETTGSFSTDPNPAQSTAGPALSGVYDGSLGTDVLEFTVTQAGVHGSDDLSLDVRTSDGTLIETINVLAGDDIDQTYTLSNGINFTLGGGSLALHESFTANISHLVPTSVNPNLSFDGIGINDAKLEDQFTVTDGSFDINGNTIQVFTSDSISSVLDRINNAGIDVTATFDAASETILMTHDIADSENDIVLSNDTSGFLAATKLDNAVSNPAFGDETTPLSQLDFMSGVTSGSLIVNGNSIAFDVDVDSLEDVIARIDAVVGSVDAEFDSGTQLVSITSNDMSNLDLSSGGTNFFAAIGISDGQFQYVEGRAGTTKQEGFSYHTRLETARAIKQFARRFNAVFEDKYGEAADPFLAKTREELKTAIGGIFGGQSSGQESTLGITVDFESDAGPLKMDDTNYRHLQKSMKTLEGAKEFNSLFFDHEDSGLVDNLLNLLGDAEREMRIEMAMAGSFVDIRA